MSLHRIGPWLAGRATMGGSHLDRRGGRAYGGGSSSGFREGGVNPPRTRRCDWWGRRTMPLGLEAREGASIRVACHRAMSQKTGPGDISIPVSRSGRAEPVAWVS